MPDAASPAPRPEAIDAALLAAERYFNQQDLASAEAILVELIEQAPREHRAHELYGGVLYLRALAARSRGHEQGASDLFEQAYEHYRRAVEAAEELDPKASAGLNQSAGEIASVAGRTEAALEHFRAAGRLDPLAAKHPLYEAQMLVQLGRLPEARRALERVLEIDPDEAFAHASLAAVAMEEGDVGAALQHIAEARRIDPAHLGIRLQEARIRRRSGRPRESLELLLALDEEVRAEEAVAQETAACYSALDDAAGAAAVWEHRFRRHPSDWRAAVKAARCRLQAGEHDAAWQLYRQAQLAAPDDPQIVELERMLRGPETDG